MQRALVHLSSYFLQFEFLILVAIFLTHLSLFPSKEKRPLSLETLTGFMRGICNI